MNSLPVSFLAEEHKSPENESHNEPEAVMHDFYDYNESYHCHLEMRKQV